MMYQLKSLQQRTFLSIILPTFVLLLLLSAGGFVLLRNILLEQWGEMAVARLQQKAFQLDADLLRPKNLFALLHQSEDSEVNRQFFSRIIHQIEELDTVVLVNINWPDFPVPQAYNEGGKNQRSDIVPVERITVSTPRYTKNLPDRTISLIADLNNAQASASGQVEIVFSFDILIQQLLQLEWWKSHKAYLLDEEANVLASTGVEIDLEDYFPMRAFGTVSKLEKDTLQALQEKPFGTVFGPGSPPEQISGYYHLQEAPWTMVVIADGETVLRPILRFRLLYFVSFAACISLILLFIRSSMSRVIVRIKKISTAAESLAKGNFGPPLTDTSKDEVGELTWSFNKMTHQLRQRLALKEAINLARDVQQNLLPQNGYDVNGLSIAGVSLYCDETGGDYYDILTFAKDQNRVAVVVADVVGHGISAALLMSSVRAFLRCRFELPGSLSEIIGDVNRLLCKDTKVSGSFVTLFCLEINVIRGSMHWIRAGHEPAFVYARDTKSFSTLMGKGVALGVDPGWVYDSYSLPLTGKNQTVLLGSDGAWELENKEGEMFGKHRIREMLSTHSSLGSKEMLLRLTDAITLFRGEAKQQDDITLVVVKIDGTRETHR